MPNTTPAKMSFEEFRKVLADVLLVGEDKIQPETSFTLDLAVDSIRWVEMALAIEKLGVAVPTHALWGIETVGDAYEYYASNYGSSDGS